MGEREQERGSRLVLTIREIDQSVPPSTPVRLPERARLEVGTSRAVYVCVPVRDNGTVRDGQTKDRRRR